jgi:hypothetical protein
MNFDMVRIFYHTIPDMCCQYLAVFSLWRISMSQRFLPAGPEEITPEWLTTVFRENAIITSGAVKSVQAEIIGQDRGFTGVIVRVRLQFAGSEDIVPSSVIVKIPTANRNTPSAYRAPQERDLTASRRYFERCAREVVGWDRLIYIT